MYCSSCGAAVAPGLTYCNHCGAKLSGAKSDSGAQASQLFPESLVWAIVSVFVVGLGSIIGLLAMMKKLDFSEHMITAVVMLSFLLTIAVVGMLIWMLLNRIRFDKGARDAERLKQPAVQALGAAQARALPEPLPSVTEHTTRTFEPLFNERKSE